MDCAIETAEDVNELDDALYAGESWEQLHARIERIKATRGLSKGEAEFVQSFEMWERLLPARNHGVPRDGYARRSSSVSGVSSAAAHADAPDSPVATSRLTACFECRSKRSMSRLLLWASAKTSALKAASKAMPLSSSENAILRFLLTMRRAYGALKGFATRIKEHG